MKKTPTLKTIFIAFICIFSLVFSLPSFIGKSKYLPDVRLNYGLDLKGGSHLLIKVDFETYLSDQLSLFSNLIHKELRLKAVSFSNLRQSANNISLLLGNESDLTNAKEIIKKINRDLEINVKGNLIELEFSGEAQEKIRANLLEQSKEVIRMRVDETGTLDPSIQRQGKSHILLQVPGLQDPSRIKSLLGRTAKLTFHVVEEVIPSNQFILPKPGSKILKSIEEQSGIAYIVNAQTSLTGDLLVNAQSSIQRGEHVVAFSFNKIGAKLFADITRKNSGKALAIVLDDRVISAPRVNEPITGGDGVISGSFTATSASELALLLRAGALPAPLEIVEERVVGPTLGEDSIESSKLAAIFGVVLVVVFMVAIYGSMGALASFALIFNLTLTIAILAILQATLTLPGVAGIVLTMGMSVDANVLIFERIKEEINNKGTIIYSVEKGFNQAFATILDSNLTTLIAAFFLYVFGTGIVKSFSVALSVGIITSMFTAITLSKFLIMNWLVFRKSRNHI